MQHRVVPGNVQKLEHLLHPLLGVEHQLLVRHAQTLTGAQLFALVVHGLHGAVPLLQALPVAGEVEAGDRHLPAHHNITSTMRKSFSGTVDSEKY